MPTIHVWYGNTCSGLYGTSTTLSPVSTRFALSRMRSSVSSGPIANTDSTQGIKGAKALLMLVRLSVCHRGAAQNIPSREGRL